MEPLTVPAVLDSLGPIGRYVLEAASMAGLDRKAAYRLRLAVDEIATNIIGYGYPKAGKTGDVLVTADVGEQTLTVALEDEAVPFDPRALTRPDHMDLPIEERPIGGLGVFLAMEGVDEYQYEYVKNRNRNIFIMKRPDR